jgi:hypothetical protein
MYFEVLQSIYRLAEEAVLSATVRMFRSLMMAMQKSEGKSNLSTDRSAHVSRDNLDRWWWESYQPVAGNVM